jgi:choice-of-anchor C domain-containing protein
MRKVAVALAVLVTFASFLAAGSRVLAAVTNGSFESGVDPGAFTTLSSGSTNITGWTVASGDVDYIGTYWQASNGSRSIDLNGLGPGSIGTLLTTVPGATYRVRFDMAGNPDGGPTVKTLNADVAGVTVPFSFDGTGATKSNMMWRSMSFTFVATGTTSTLRFISTIASGGFGPAIDNVSVEQISEPPSSFGSAERPLENKGGVVAAIAAAAGKEARDRRAAAAAAAAAPPVSPPSTGTGIIPPNTGDGGLRSYSNGEGPATLPAALLLVMGAIMAAIAWAHFAREARR